ncbi:olfactory receptor 1019-like [Gadus chalcogrammus]|uniref:olfactory receptor 1019-like n=1 Tax=Gadus chalcogrammus TaxID=1042646 RepID=UPI0024C4BDD3|nr:olfactory receptor 1019-like [Gadus chalcogrammus]
MDNVSVVTLFTLSGLNYTMDQKIVLFSFFLLWYIAILFFNISIIVIIIMDKRLHEPMYIFLCNLCINGLYGTAGFFPKFLWDLLTSHVISYAQCMVQGFVVHSASITDLSILALMAYDRYVAICRPLVYYSVMTKQRVSIFVFFSWFIPLNAMFANSVSLVGMPLCGSHINRLYCVNWMIVQLACSTRKVTAILGYINIIFYFSHGVFIGWSYMYLIKMCLASKDKMGKFMATCVPHLLSMIIFSFALSLDVLYMRFGSKTLSQNLMNFISIEFLLFPSFMNPLIYGFKLTKIRNIILSFLPARRRNVECKTLKLVEVPRDLILK